MLDRSREGSPAIRDFADAILDDPGRARPLRKVNRVPWTETSSRHVFGADDDGSFNESEGLVDPVAPGEPSGGALPDNNAGQAIAACHQKSRSGFRVAALDPARIDRRGAERRIVTCKRYS